MKPKVWGPKAWFFIHAIAFKLSKKSNISAKRIL